MNFTSCPFPMSRSKVELLFSKMGQLLSVPDGGTSLTKQIELQEIDASRHVGKSICDGCMNLFV